MIPKEEKELKTRLSRLEVAIFGIDFETAKKIIKSHHLDRIKGDPYSEVDDIDRKARIMLGV